MRSDLVGFAKQTVKGTGVYVAEYIVPVESADLAANVEVVDLVETLGKRFPSEPPSQGSAAFEVTAAGAIRPAAIPRLLSSFMGAPTSTSVGTLGKQHTFDMYAADTALLLHSILIGRADPTPKITDWAYDCYGSSLEITCAPNEFMRFNGTWQGKSLNTAQTFPVAPVSDTTERFPYHEVTVNISIDGAAEAAVPCSDLSITITNEIDLDYLALGAQNPYDIGVGNGTCEISFTPLQNLDLWLRRAYPGATSEIKLRAIAVGSLIETASFHEVEFTAYRGKVTEASAAVSAADILKGVPVTMSFAKDRTLAKFVDARIKNKVASY